jgi:hypothetical protein
MKAKRCWDGSVFLVGFFASILPVDVEELEALQQSTFHKICNFSFMYSQGY